MLRAHSRSLFARRLFLFALALLGLASCSVYLYSRNAAAAGMKGAGSATSRPDEVAQEARVAESYANLPLRFEINEGQTDSNVRFLSHGRGYSLFLTPSEAVLALGDSNKSIATSEGKTSEQKDVASPAVLRMSLVGAAANPHIEGRGELPGKSNYFIGDDPHRWRTNVTGYAQVQYSGVYPGVDMIYYGKQRQLEYDFVVAPGASPQIISLGFDGAEKIEIDEQGDLVLHVAGRQVRQHKPFIYQDDAGGVRREIFGGYVLKGEQIVGFRVGEYDARRPLIIDPVLSY